MTKQETFDTVVRALIAQGGPSTERTASGIRCRYRGDGGRKCAAGQLIPDDWYEEAMEGRSVSDGADIGAVLAEHGHDLCLVGDLQYRHDNASWTRNAEGHYPSDAEWLAAFLEGAHEVAKNYGLDASACAAPAA